MGLDKNILTYMNHHSIIKNIFTALKVLCDLPTHPHHKPLIIFFIVFIILPFTEGHIVGIILSVGLADWLILLSHPHLISTSFPGLRAVLFLQLNNIYRLDL